VSFRKWLESAILELKRAHERFERKDYAYVCFHAEQAVQFALKALLKYYGNFLKTHDIVKLLERCRVHGFNINVNIEDLRELTIHYLASRYPNARLRYSIKYNERIAIKAIKLAEKVVESVRNCLSI